MSSKLDREKDKSSRDRRPYPVAVVDLTAHDRLACVSASCQVPEVMITALVVAAVCYCVLQTPRHTSDQVRFCLVANTFTIIVSRVE